MQKTTLSDNPSLYLLSLGCPKNRVDSEVMLGSLLDEGYKLVDEPRDAEVILINSCAFIGEAKQESIDAILEHAQLKETGRCKALVVAGCLTQRYADVLQQEMPEVDYFVGTSAYPQIAKILKGERDRAVIPDPDYIADSRTPRRNSMPRWTAYVKISEGCDNQCSFCIIPKLRGLQRSRPIADIVAEAERLASEGAVELNLVAQDLTAYGYDLPGRPKLHDLLQALRGVNARWIRLHYAWVRRLVHRIRERVPDLTFRTSFIVGFPGETDAQFRELCDFVEEMRFEKVGVFQFSREEGTASFDLDGQLPQRVKAQRQKALLGIQRRISKRHQQAMVGRTLDVLVEGVSEETELLLEGRWMGQAPEIDGKVYVNRGQARPGEIVRVEIEQAGDYDLVGGIAGAEGPAEPLGVARPAPPRPRFPILSH